MARGLTLEEPDIARLVFKRGVHGVWDASPVAGGEGRVATLQVAVADPPHVAALEEEQLAADHGHGVKVCVTRVRLEHRSCDGRLNKLLVVALSFKATRCVVASNKSLKV